MNIDNVVYNTYKDSNVIDSRGDFLKRNTKGIFSCRDLLFHLINDCKDKNILDVGCGSCSFLKKFKLKNPNNNFYAIDLVYNDKCNVNGINYFIYDGINFPFESNVLFDNIYLMHMLYHIEDIKGFFMKIKSYLIKNGKIYITTKSKQSLFKLEEIFLKTIKEIGIDVGFFSLKKEEKFCLENALDKIGEVFYLPDFIVSQTVLKREIYVNDFDDLFNYFISTYRYNISNTDLTPDLKETYTSIIKDEIKKMLPYEDEVIECVYVIESLK